MSDQLTQEQENRLRQLFEAYLSGELKAEEREELAKGLETPEGEAIVKSVMERRVEEEPAAESLATKAAIDKWLDERVAPPRVRSIPKFWYGVAAAVLIGLVGAFVYLQLKPQTTTDATAGRYRNDLNPGKDKAVLQLSDGRKIELNEKVSGSIPNQEGASISEDSGWLRYTASGEARYNDLYTPVGAQIKVLLADGTKVWLDASSSIHYPTAFPSGNREVTITGQAYFEIAPNARQPFIVHAKDQTIRVLGTHFNVNAYEASEAAVRTTLEQGSVLVSSGDTRLKLTPGQQADGKTLRSDVDLEEVLAWKNGEFRFNGASIRVIMDQLARWYGAEIRYKDDIKEEFVAKIPRNVPISKVLKYLEATGQVRFDVEGNVITVMK